MQMRNAGFVVGLEEIDQGLGLDLAPYVSGNITATPAADDPRTYSGDAGFDLF
jgi:hypothetical protein